jgi:LysR family transcriptional regulator, glycine cleavage system transcriptional activator
MSDALPPLNALRAFAAAARHLSFTRAAQELHVTQTAVSHQMRILEQHLGLRLFLRLPRRLVLTPEGQAYARELAHVFDRVAEATAPLRGTPGREILSVTTTGSLAARWLTPRLGSFIARHPHTDLRLVSTERFVDFAREPVDVGIRFGYGRYAGLRTEKIMDDELYPVCSPALLGKGTRTRRRRPGLDLRRCVLLHDDSADGWRRWLRACGVSGVDVGRGHTFTDANLTLQAAADGHGVALGRHVLVARDLAAGRLVRPFPQSVPCEPAYYLVTAEHAADLPKVRRFRAWLVDEIARDGRARAAGPARAG